MQHWSETRIILTDQCCTCKLTRHTTAACCLNAFCPFTMARRRDRPGGGSVTMVSARRSAAPDQSTSLRLRLRQPTPRHEPLSSRAVRRIAAGAAADGGDDGGGQVTGGGTVRAMNSIASSVACRALIKRPWQAPSVARLANQLARRGGAESGVLPMMVEGPMGTVLAAVGDERAHSIAGDVLSRCAEEQQQKGGGGGGDRGWRTSRNPSAVERSSRQSSRSRSGQLTVRGSGGGSVGGRVPQTARDAGGSGARTLVRREPAFGAVYEHRDSFGKPVVVGETDTVPELAFERDLARHKQLRDLATYKGGSAAVVWAGCGQNRDSIAAVRSAVAKDRAERNRCDKLAGPKPYSAHGF